MSETNRTPEDETVSVVVQIDRLCDRYEFLRLAGSNISVGDFLRDQGLDPTAVNPELLNELERLADYYHPDNRPTVATEKDDEDTLYDIAAGVVYGGRYKLLQEIGGGGMGVVWMAQQTEPFERLVAVKVIKPGMDSRTVLARFEAERQALALMEHANIAKVYDAGTTPTGRPYFVMELVKGVPITHYCDALRLTPKERLKLFVTVCEAIQHAHVKGIVHRDIKPSNVLVALNDGKPVVKVIDFGIAKATGESLTNLTLVTGFGAIVGTLEYMSPEQATLNNLDIDTRSDVYSLGVLLYELLTGTTPVKRKSLDHVAVLEVLRQVREVDAPRPSDRLSSSDALPSLSANRGTEPLKLVKLFRGELDWVLLKALEKERDRRYQSANAFAADVRNYLADEMVSASPPSRRYRLRKFVRRNRTAVWASAAVFFALLVGVTGTTLGLLEARKQAADAEDARGKEATQRGIADTNAHNAQAAQTVAQQEKLKALAVAATSGLDQGQQVCESGDVARGLHVLAKALRPAIESGDAAVEEAIRYSLAAWLPQAFQLKGTVTGNHFAGCLKPDGTVLLTGGGSLQTDSADGFVECWDTSSFRQTCRKLSTGAAVMKLAWQPKGDIVAILCRDGTLRLWQYGRPWRSARSIRVCNPMIEVLHGGLSFSPDGTKLLVGSLGRSAQLFDVVRGEPIGPGFYHGSTHADAVAISPDGTRVVVGTPNWSARVYDLATAKPLTPVIRTLGSNFCAGISPDGTKFFTGHHMDGSLQVWDMTTGAAAGVRIAPGGSPLAAQFSPDGQTILITGWMNLTHLWDWKTGKPVGSPIPVSGYAAGFNANGTGFFLSSPGGGTSVWGLPDRGLEWTSERLPGSVHSYALRADSKELAISMSAAFTPDSDPTQTPFLRRYSIPTGEPVKPYLPARHSRFASCLAYSPDGRTLYCVEGAGVTRFDLTTNREIDRLIPPPPAKDYGRMALSDDGRYLAITGDMLDLAVYDLSTSRWVQREDTKRWGQSVLGFVPGTHRLLDCSNNKLLSWDFDLPQAASSTVLETQLGYVGRAALRSDGRAMLLGGHGGKAIEFDLVTCQPTGVRLGNMGTVSLVGKEQRYDHYTPEGRWLYSTDNAGTAAWHLPTLRKLGPYLLPGYGTALGVTADGEHVVTVNEGRRLQCWRVPKPMQGTPEEVDATVIARTGLANSDGNHLSIRFSPRPAGESDLLPQSIVFDFREIHNADLNRLKQWFANLPKDFRPVHLSEQVGSGGTRFDALAIDDGTTVPFEARLALAKGVDDNTMWAKGWGQALRMYYSPRGTSGLHHVVWMKGVQAHIAWKELDAAVKEFRGHKLRPVSVVQYGDQLLLTGIPDNGLAWEAFRDLTAAQLVEKMTDARKRKWRPSLVHRHNDKSDCFALVLVENPQGLSWEFHSELQQKEYESKLADAKVRGLRPEYVHSWVVGEKPVYSAVWVGDYHPAKLPPEVAPEPRLAK